MGNIIMFAMVYSSPNRVAPQADQCLGGQFACALMYYAMFWTIVDVTNGCLGVGCGVCFGDKKVFHVGFNIKLPQQLITNPKSILMMADLLQLIPILQYC
jgi:hypothetical protein